MSTKIEDLFPTELYQHYNPDAYQFIGDTTTEPAESTAFVPKEGSSFEDNVQGAIMHQLDSASISPEKIIDLGKKYGINIDATNNPIIIGSDGNPVESPYYTQFKEELATQLSGKIIQSYIKNQDAIETGLASDPEIQNYRQKKLEINSKIKELSLGNEGVQIDISDDYFNSILGVKPNELTGFHVSQGEGDNNYYTDMEGNFLYDTGGGGYIVDGKSKVTHPEYNPTPQSHFNMEGNISKSYDMHHIHKYKNDAGEYVQNDYTSRLGTDQNWFDVGDMIAEVKTFLGTQNDNTYPTFQEFAMFYATKPGGVEILTDGMGNFKSTWTVKELKTKLKAIDSAISTRIAQADTGKEELLNNLKSGDSGYNAYWFSEGMGAEWNPESGANIYGHHKQGGWMPDILGVLDAIAGTNLSPYTVNQGQEFSALKQPYNKSISKGRKPTDILDTFDINEYSSQFSEETGMSDAQKLVADSYWGVVELSQDMHELEKARMVISWMLNGRGFTGDFENFNYSWQYEGGGLQVGLPGSEPWVDIGGKGSVGTISYDNFDWSSNVDSNYKERFQFVLDNSLTYSGIPYETEIPLRSQNNAIDKVYFSGLKNDVNRADKQINFYKNQKNQLDVQYKGYLENNYGDLCEDDVCVNITELLSMNDLDLKLNNVLDSTITNLLEESKLDPFATEAYGEIINDFRQHILSGNYKIFIQE